MLANCRVVLVRTEVAGNIGATARVMRNFGLNDLVLVAPVADPSSHEAKQRSTHGEPILNSARKFATLVEAVGDCRLVVGTSARSGGLIRGGMTATPEQVIPHMLRHISERPVTLVFGPERNGLTNDEITKCDHLIEIPANPEYPALNLSHAVAICLYELCRQAMSWSSPKVPDPVASHDERERMYAHLRSGLEAIHFLYDEKADALMHAVRALLNRTEPNLADLKLLHGLARQLEWVAKNRSATLPPE
ncbi:MAG: RNA methyltransferase [Gemmataceae bacterium]